MPQLTDIALKAIARAAAGTRRLTDYLTRLFLFRLRFVQPFDGFRHQVPQRFVTSRHPGASILEVVGFWIRPVEQRRRVR